MLNYIHDNFTVNVTDEDIVAPNRGNWWDNPVRRAVMRQFKLSYPIEVRVGDSYADIYFPTETDKFNVDPYKDIVHFMDNWQHGWLVQPTAFEFKLVKVVAKPPVSDVTPKRFENRRPSRIAKTGI